MCMFYRLTNRHINEIRGWASREQNRVHHSEVSLSKGNLNVLSLYTATNKDTSSYYSDSSNTLFYLPDVEHTQYLKSLKGWYYLYSHMTMNWVNTFLYKGRNKFWDVYLVIPCVNKCTIKVLKVFKYCGVFAPSKKGWATESTISK
jgi:hypothetical protein